MKRALVTGGGAGIGAAIAVGLHEAGYFVGILDRDGYAANTVAAKLENAIAIKADISVPDQISTVFKDFGGLDVLINNAGIVRFGPLLEIALEDVQSVIDVNLRGSFLVAQSAAQAMQGSGGGVIVNMTSINAVHPAPEVGFYAATKAALTSLTSLMAIEWGPLGIRVNAIAPGFIDAGMSAPVFSNPEVRAKRSAGVPVRSLGTAFDVVNAVLYLVSDQARYVNGHQLVVDGGVINSVLAHLPRN
ncbi:MAG: short-chain dehydrogenase [Gammaproteobacteria bacterium]|nr:short-chain dehydrogenase [Gammaproteobacteria bacterium]